ncbi:MAG TPA: peroxiredoxin [Burkholderiales bacterium]|nr:peroxiredoxin [Burkholderiales bacterium]
MFPILILAAAAAAAWLGWRIVRRSGRVPGIGEPAPEFALPDQAGVVRHSGEFRGRWLALYFYPRDDTPGCRRQAACFRDAHEALAEAGITVCGVSLDDAASHARFAAKYALPYTLLADTQGRVARQYGSLFDASFVRFARRNTFLIDPAGRIAAVHKGVTPAASADQLLSDIERLAAR